MEFRKAVESDIEEIMNIIKGAQEYLKDQGVDQWQNGYPNHETIKSDIDNGYGYVLLKDGGLVGTVAIIFEGEKTYDYIEEGNWLTNGKYCTIHRIAVDTEVKGQGLSGVILKNVEEISLEKEIKSIKVDTHRDNQAMQSFLTKNGFRYCGIIYLEDGSERLAFEKVI